MGYSYLDYAHLPAGRRSRLAGLTHHSAGRIALLDTTGTFRSPMLVDAPHDAFRRAAEASLSAVATSLGVAQTYYPDYAELVPLVLDVNGPHETAEGTWGDYAMQATVERGRPAPQRAGGPIHPGARADSGNLATPRAPGHARRGAPLRRARHPSSPVPRHRQSRRAGARHRARRAPPRCGPDRAPCCRPPQRRGERALLPRWSEPSRRERPRPGTTRRGGGSDRGRAAGAPRHGTRMPRSRGSPSRLGAVVRGGACVGPGPARHSDRMMLASASALPPSERGCAAR